MTLAALKNHFYNPNLKEKHHINSENMIYNHKTETPEEFLVEFQNLALKVYPRPVVAKQIADQHTAKKIV